MNAEYRTIEDAVGDWKEQVIIINDDGSQTTWTKKSYDEMIAQSEANTL